MAKAADIILWEGLPFLMPLGLFLVLAVINWDYESKLIALNRGLNDWTVVYMGPLLLAGAFACSLIGAGILLIVRLVSALRDGWPRFTVLTLVAIFWIFPSMFIVLLGPAAISMMTSMQQVPEK